MLDARELLSGDVRRSANFGSTGFCVSRCCCEVIRLLRGFVKLRTGVGRPTGVTASEMMMTLYISSPIFSRSLDVLHVLAIVGPGRYRCFVILAVFWGLFMSPTPALRNSAFHSAADRYNQFPQSTIVGCFRRCLSCDEAHSFIVFRPVLIHGTVEIGECRYRHSGFCGLNSLCYVSLRYW